MNTLDKLIKYYEQSTKTQKINQKLSGINNFNNVETSYRKLIINNKLEFQDNTNYSTNKRNGINNKGKELKIGMNQHYHHIST